MKRIALSLLYRFLYMLAGAFALFASAYTLAGRDDSGKWWVWVVASLYLAWFCEQQTKAPQR